jgi:hypothetical protein
MWLEVVELVRVAKASRADLRNSVDDVLSRKIGFLTDEAIA